MTKEEFADWLEEFESEVEECVHALEYGTGRWSHHQRKAAEIREKLIEFVNELIDKVETDS